MLVVYLDPVNDKLLRRSSPGTRRFALADRSVFGGPAHQRRIIGAEQQVAEADRRGYLCLAVSPVLALAAAQGLHQCLGGLLDIVLKIGVGPQRDLIDRQFAGIGAAYRDEFDQRSRIINLAGVDLRSGGNVLVGALTEQAPDAAGHAVDFRL